MRFGASERKRPLTERTTDALRATESSRSIFGVDFSGAQDAGKRIWIAEAALDDTRLVVRSCRPARELPDSGVDRDQCLAALRDFVRAQTQAVFGLDFPFGLPRELVPEADWRSFLSRFADCFRSPDVFKIHCWQNGGQHELRRQTDRDAGTPWSAYNLQLYKQTYYGIHDVLAPLVLSEHAVALPMQALAAEKVWLMEICPASLLKALDIPTGKYKSRKLNATARCAARTHILESTIALASLELAPGVRKLILDNSGGDALDAVLAAVAVARALRSPDSLIPPCAAYRLEGYVYC